jgi:hypothetical protein
MGGEKEIGHPLGGFYYLEDSYVENKCSIQQPREREHSKSEQDSLLRRVNTLYMSVSSMVRQTRLQAEEIFLRGLYFLRRKADMAQEIAGNCRKLFSTYWRNRTHNRTRIENR